MAKVLINNNYSYFTCAIFNHVYLIYDNTDIFCLYTLYLVRLVSFMYYILCIVLLVPKANFKNMKGEAVPSENPYFINQAERQQQSETYYIYYSFVSGTILFLLIFCYYIHKNNAPLYVTNSYIYNRNFLF